MDYHAGQGTEVEDHEWGRVYVCTYWPEGRLYIRGDADLDGDVDLTDAIVLLGRLFDGKPTPCEEALDTDRTGEVDITDAIVILVYRFMGGLTPEQPFPECGRLESLRGELPCERSYCD